MRMNLDKILEFLYGDKKAELMAEISFVKYAYQNYNSIMSHEAQRTATIASIQKAKKVAMKDIEFYMNDLDSAAKTKDNSELISTVNKAFQIKESLELSMQLYVFSNLLELYYSQNADSSYIKYVEADVSSYIDKCEKRMLSSFSVLDAFVRDYKGNLLKKIDTSEIEKEVGGLLDRLNNGGRNSNAADFACGVKCSDEEGRILYGRGRKYLFKDRVKFIIFRRIKNETYRIFNTYFSGLSVRSCVLRGWSKWL